MSMTQLSFSDASALVETCPYSSLQQISKVRHIVLPPKFLGNISNGVKEKLNSELQLATNWTDGVLVAYNNVKVLDHVGKIFEESPYVHFNIQADYIIFKPTIGCILKGIVNKKSPRHVGCLVHNCFNASVHKPRHEGEDWVGNNLQLGEEFLFKVTNLYVHNGVMSLRGNLWEASSHSKKKAPRQQTEMQEAMEEGEGSTSDLTDSGIGDITLHKSSKKKNKSSFDSDLLSRSLEDDNEFLNETETGSTFDQSGACSDNEVKDKSSKKKKKHKKQEIKVKEEIVCEEQLETSGSLDTSKHKKHKKKRKSDLGAGDKHSGNDSCDTFYIKVEPGISVKNESFETSQFNVATTESVSKKKKNKKRQHKGELDKNSSLSHNLLESQVDSSDKIVNGNKLAKKRKHSSVNETIEHSLLKKNRKSV